MQIRVKYDGQDFDLPDYGPSDFVAFERHFKVSAAALSPEEGDKNSVMFEWICFLVYRGLKRIDALKAEDAVGGFTEAFIDRLSDLVFEDEDDADEAEPKPGDEHRLDPSDQAALPG